MMNCGISNKAFVIYIIAFADHTDFSYVTLMK